MKRYFMITVFPVIWLIIGLLSAPVFSDEEPNPFREGTEKKTLTEDEKQSLLQYANTSKTTLEKAKRESQGKPLQETLDIYTNAITSVILKSFNEEKRRELLMRVSLNQALQLTVGIPTPDGKAVEEEGVLTHAPLDLIAAILENAIDLALSYYPKDKEAIEAGDLLKLPFFEYAACRLSQAKSWITGIHSWQLQLEFEKVILEQWKSSVLSDQNLERERVAPLILNVEEALTKVTLPQYTVSQKVRLLRGTIRQLLEDSGGERRVTTAGAVFTRDTSHPALGEAWRDPDSLIWGDIVKNEDGSERRMVQSFAYASEWNMYIKKIGEPLPLPNGILGAKEYCESIGARLPSREEITRLREYMGAQSGTHEGYSPQVLPNLLSDSPIPFFWSSSVRPNNIHVANIFVSNNGDIGTNYRLDDNIVRCVVDR